MRKLFGKKNDDKKKEEEKKKEEKKKEEKKKEEKKAVEKRASLKETQSLPQNFDPPKAKPKPAPVIQPSATQTITTSNTITDPNTELQEGEVNQGQQEELLDEQPLIEMKKGDYNVHILIEEVKNLVPVKENTPPVPRVKMTVFDKVQRTSKMKNPCYDFAFNEHFYFDKTNLTVEMLNSFRASISSSRSCNCFWRLRLIFLSAFSLSCSCCSGVSMTM